MIKNQNKFNFYTRKITIVSLAILAVFLFTGCLRVYTHTKGLSPNAYPLDGEKYDIIEEQEEKSSSFNLLWFFPVTPSISYNEAVYNAISKSGGDNLVDVYSWHERQYWIVGTVNILYVKGKVVKYSD